MRAIWEAENADVTKELGTRCPEDDKDYEILQEIASIELHCEVQEVKPEPIPDALLL